MTDEKFKELVHLYLDGEIAPGDAERLRREVASDPERRHALEERRRLQRAMQLALGGQGRASADGGDAAGWRRWWPGLAVAACVAVVSVLIVSALVSPEDAGFSDLTGESDAAAIERVRPEDVRSLRLLAGEAERGGSRGGLAARLRLSGLRPELAPADQPLRAVDRESLAARQEAITREIRKLREASDGRADVYGWDVRGRWASPGGPEAVGGFGDGSPGGFSSSLVGFD